jgi:hypothetical protein
MLVTNISGLHIPHHDYLSISPTAAPTNDIQTITFRRGGPTGVIVATQVITYVNGDVSTVQVN